MASDSTEEVQGTEAVQGTEETEEDVSIPDCVSFSRKGKSEHLLIATVEPNTDFPVGIPVHSVHAWIRAQGCAQWFLNHEEITRLAREIRKLDNPKEYTVAERKDCKIEMQLSPDRLQAWIRVLPAYGGVALTEALLAEALENYQIRFGIHEELRARILQQGECERELIAEGIPAAPGESAKFEPLVHESEHKGIPQEREHGRVDYKELGLFLSVGKDTPLLQRIPPTQGVAGKAVDGTEIPPPAGTDRPLRPGPGTAISKDDPDIVIATRVGQPAFEENSVRVDPTLEIEAVNASTGNVNFDGNILIHGSVEAGFKVNASQDLTILDTVEGADIIAGKHLILMTGVYGKGKSKITAGGNLEARFLNECLVRCGGNIEVADLIAHCTLECDGSIYLGRSGGRGQIMGGKLLALKEVHAHILGSVSEAATHIEIGISKALLQHNALLEKEMIETQQILESLDSRLQSLAEAHVDAQNPNLIKLKDTRTALADKQESLKKEHTAIQNRMAIADNGLIKAAEVHRGVILCIGSHRQITNDLVTDLSFRKPVEEPQPQDEQTPAKETRQEQS